MMQQVLERSRPGGAAPPRAVSHRVLVGVDESTAGTAALRWAAGEAFRRGAVLTAARAIPGPPALRPSFDQLRWETGRRLRDAVAAVTGPQPTETLVLEGDPGGALVDLSAATELLVLGRSSRTGRRLSGSITRYCLLHAHCPVVLVPAESYPDFPTAPVEVEPQDRHVGVPRTPAAELVGSR